MYLVPRPLSTGVFTREDAKQESRAIKSYTSPAEHCVNAIPPRDESANHEHDAEAITGKLEKLRSIFYIYFFQMTLTDFKDYIVLNATKVGVNGGFLSRHRNNRLHI